MKKIIVRHKSLWADRAFVVSVVFSFVLFIVSFYINYIAGTYATKKISNGVSDFFLDILPVWDMKWVVVNIATLLLIGLVGILLAHPARIPFVIKSISIFIFIRSGFISLTHIGPYIDLSHQLTPFEGIEFIGRFAFGGDLFFSGHTGMPFLIALIFWKNIRLRYLALITMFVQGSAVLLGAYHYSIDVFAAPFITFAIFHLCKWLFRRDYNLLQSSVERTGF